MTDVEFRKFQESMANLVCVKDEISKGAYQIYISFQNSGFTKKEAFDLVKAMFIGKAQ